MDMVEKDPKTKGSTVADGPGHSHRRVRKRMPDMGQEGLWVGPRLSQELNSKLSIIVFTPLRATKASRNSP